MRFKDLAGQSHIRFKLAEAVLHSRISHAQLFIGPRGAGKLAMAVAYAQFINCTHKQGTDSCGSCPSCVKYEKLIHPDLHFIYPVFTTEQIKKDPQSKHFAAEWREVFLVHKGYPYLEEWYVKLGVGNKQSSINVLDCNEIIKALGPKAFEAEYKVVIIWMPERIHHAAAPKILKILEEPPDKTLFLLVSEQPDQLLNTIRSRCQLVKFPKISDNELLLLLKSNYNYSGSRSKRLLQLANGNFREAVRLVAEDEGDQEQFLAFRQWFRLCYQFSMTEISQFTEQFARYGREKQKAFFLYAIQCIREIVVLNYQGEAFSRVDGEEQVFIKNLAPFVHGGNMEALYEELNLAIFHIERNAHPKILMLDLSFKVNQLLKQKVTV